MFPNSAACLLLDGDHPDVEAIFDYHYVMSRSELFSETEDGDAGEYFMSRSRFFAWRF